MAPRLLSEDYPFCEESPFLAFKFLRTAHMILERDEAYTEKELRQFVNAALDELLGYLKECDNCKERQHLKVGTFFDDRHKMKNARD